MVSLQTPICDFGWKAPDFDLPGVDGKRYRLADVVGPKGLLVMFICNHCPYVKAVRQRIVRDAKELLAHGIQCVAISANDAAQFPEDDFAHMKKSPANGIYPSPISTTKVRLWPKPMAQSARRIFSGLIASSNCSTAAGSTNRAKRPQRKMYAAICSRQCAKWLKPATAPKTKSPAWAVLLNGRSEARKPHSALLLDADAAPGYR